MKILIVEDSPIRQEVFRERYPDAIITSNYREAIEAMDKCDFDFMSLDHDLGETEVCNGYLVAKYIANLPCHRYPREVQIHSLNRIGALRMFEVLYDAGIRVTYRPFSLDD